ncbi:GLSK-like protein, partial [Mya arenaria]
FQNLIELWHICCPNYCHSVEVEFWGKHSLNAISKRCIAPNIVLITNAFRNQFVVATYIPQLARYSPDKWGVSLCTVDGQRYSNGDFQVPFSLQSVSKPLTYAMALDELSPSVVHKYVGQEPNKPHNPMINAGAICVSSLLKQDLDPADRFAYATSVLNRLTGGEHLAFNNSVFLSERATADRNFALAYYMSEKRVGLPAKSGVSGVILIVVPNKMGFCTWSPALDKWGNSTRGVYFAEDLVAKFNFHHYDNLKFTAKKIDPCIQKIESRASGVVGLLFSAYTCDEAMNQYNANEKIDRSFAAIDSVAYHDIALKTVNTVEDASEHELNGTEGDKNDM